MRPEVYEIWREEWQKYHPHQLPPTIDQVSEIMDLLLITEEQLFGMENSDGL